MQPIIGNQIGRYRIQSLIGEGGMGEVYKAYDPRLERVVAIKVMHPQYSRQSTFRGRFSQEAVTAAKLDHPGIVKIYDSGEENGILYIVMEFIAGPNLRWILNKIKKESRLLDSAEAAETIRQVCVALDYAHRQGVLHRDIKPDNIMLKSEATGRLPLHPVLTDLGLAKLIEGLPLTRDGESLGTPAYMSPEQALGLPLDARSDVYSLGILLYEMAVGNLPFPAKTLSEAIRYHNNEPPPNPQQLRSDIPAQLVEVILKSLAKKPDQRYANASALSQGIETVIGSMILPSKESKPGRKIVSLLSQYQENIAQNKELPSERQKQDSPVSEGDFLDIRAIDGTNSRKNLSEQPVTIGRGDDNDIVLDDPKASRHHARLEFDGSNYQITDLNSTNGSLLGDAKLLPGVREVWFPEKVLRIGGTMFSLSRSKLPSSDKTGQVKRSDLLSFTSVGGRVGISLDSDMLTVDPGNSVTSRISLVNQSSVVDHFRAAVEGIPIEWLTQASPEVQLLPLEKAGIELVIQPPRSIQSKAGQYNLIIRVAGRAAPGDVAEANATLTVNPFYAVQSVMQPQKQRGPEVGNFNLSTENRSNTDLKVSYSASNPEDSCSFSFNPPTVVISPGATQQIQMSVRSKYPLQDWSSHSFPFCVMANIVEFPALNQQLQGEFEQIAPTLDISLKPSKSKGMLQGNFLVALANHSYNPIDVTLEAMDPASVCQHLFEISKLNLPPGGERLVRLTVQPKGQAIIEHSRIIPFTVIARLSQGSKLSREVEGEWEQIAPALEIALQPQKQRDELVGKYAIQVTNNNDADLTSELRVTGLEEICNAAISPAQLHLLPGETVSARLEVRALSHLRGKEPQTMPFEVNALITGTTRPIARIQGEFEQLPSSQPPTTLPEPVVMLKPKRSFISGCLLFIVGIIMTYIVAIFVLSPTNSGQSLPEFLVVVIPGLALTSTIAYRAWKKKKIVPLVVIAIVFTVASFLYYLASSRNL